MRRALLSATTFLLTTVAASALVPPLPEDQAAYGPGASQYVTADGTETLWVNPGASRWAHYFPRPPQPADVPMPTHIPPHGEAFGAVQNCSDASTICMSFVGVAVSLSRQIKPEINARWQAGPWSFHVKGCASECRLRIVAAERGTGPQTMRAWFMWSPQRGVEAFRLDKADGMPGPTFVLANDVGLLR
jgi:hypothetical protein